MALAHYRDLYWFPNGALAPNVPARVFPFGSNGLATLWADQAGTIPLPNPLNTDGAAFLDFWAEEGEYWIYIDQRSFRVSVGNPVNLDPWDGASVALSTGTMSGGQFAAAGTSISVGETVGYVVDYATDDVRPMVKRVHILPTVVPLSAPALARTLTWWLIDSNGNVLEQPLAPTAVQRRTHIVLGFSIVFGGVVAFTKPVPVSLPQPANQLADLMDSIGTFTISGAEFTPNGANLMLNTSAGLLFSRSFGYELTPQTPNVAPFAAQSPAQFRIATQNTTVFGAPVTVVDPANYDVGGTITPVPGGANASTLQRIFIFAQANAPDQIVIQYGQIAHPNLQSAVNAAALGGYTVNPAFVASLAGYLAVTKTATNLSDPLQAVLIPSPAKFSRP